MKAFTDHVLSVAEKNYRRVKAFGGSHDHALVSAMAEARAVGQRELDDALDRTRDTLSRGHLEPVS